MPDIYSIAENLRDNFSNFFRSTLEFTKQWGVYTVKQIKDLPQHMQRDQNVALAVIFAANNIIFLTLHSIAKRLDEQLTGSSLTKRVVKHIFVDVGFVGGSTYGLNFLLSELTQYKLSKTTLLAISLTAMTLRIFLRPASLKTSMPDIRINTDDQQKIALNLKEKEKNLNDLEKKLLAREASLNSVAQLDPHKMHIDTNKLHVKFKTPTKLTGPVGTPLKPKTPTPIKPKSVSEEIQQLKDKHGACDIIRRCVGSIIHRRKYRKTLFSQPGFDRERMKNWKNHKDFPNWVKTLELEKINNQIPPPPPMEGDIPPPPIDNEVFIEVFYPDEPTAEPQISINPNCQNVEKQIKSLSDTQRATDILNIQNYIKSLETALESVLTKKNKVLSAEISLCEEISQQKLEEKLHEENKLRRQILESPDPVSYLYYTSQALGEVQCPFYSDDAIKAEWMKMKAANKSVKILRKSDYVVYAKALEEESAGSVALVKERVQEAQEQLDQLKSSPNPLSKDNEEKNLLIKSKKLQTWKQLLKKYEHKPKVKDCSGPSVAPVQSVWPTTLIHLQPWEKALQNTTFNMLVHSLEKLESLGNTDSLLNLKPMKTT